MCVWRFSSRFRQKFIENRSRRGGASSIRLVPRVATLHVVTLMYVLHSATSSPRFWRILHKLWPTGALSIEHKYRDCGVYVQPSHPQTLQTNHPHHTNHRHRVCTPATPLLTLFEPLRGRGVVLDSGSHHRGSHHEK